MGDATKMSNINYNETFKFTDACRVGVPVIDSEHEHLFNFMNHVIASFHDENRDNISLEEYIEVLFDYGKRHFQHEEEYMREINDPELEHQLKQHAQFVKKINSINLHDLEDHEKDALVIHLIEFSLEWLYDHVLYSDILIGKMKHLADTAVEVTDETGTHLVYCPFEEKYRTGNEKCDEENKVIFELLNKAYTMLENNYSENDFDREKEILDDLAVHCIYHYANEEEALHAARYPEYDAHIHAHGAFLDRLDERDDAEGRPDQREFLEELLDYLYAWITYHITHMGKHASDFLRQHENDKKVGKAKFVF